jgi:hypothetical protein
MNEHPEEPDEQQSDERASIPPTEDEGDAAREDPEGPRGNPDVDEEALRHGQQDRGR